MKDFKNALATCGYESLL